MIDEAIGKILGMAMAYGVSTLGLFLAYVNYRKRTLKAEKIMTPHAWGVVAITVLVLAGGVLVVSQLAQVPAAEEGAAETVAEAPAVEAPAEPVPPPVEPASAASVPSSGGSDEPRERWPTVGIVLPGAIFLIATWITAALHRRFSIQPE
jgi:hypothetical protein